MGLVALADALELLGTFGIPRKYVLIPLAGGREALINLAGGHNVNIGQVELDIT